MSANAMGDAILDAIFRQKTRLVRFYMSWDGTPEYRSQGLGLIHIAVLENDPVLLETALSNGFSPNSITDSGDTALHILARRKKTSYTELTPLFHLLRNSGANLYARDSKGSTPMDVARAADNSVFETLMGGIKPTYVRKKDWSLFKEWHPAVPAPEAIKEESDNSIGVCHAGSQRLRATS